MAVLAKRGIRTLAVDLRGKEELWLTKNATKK